MTLAVTGATGFVGQAVLDVALGAGLTVRALTRRPQPPRAGVEWIEGGLSDEAALLRLAEGADRMLHIAALTNAPDPAAFEAANVTGTAAVAAACRRSGTQHLLFVSSLSAREPQLSAYGASKAAAEQLLEASGLEWSIVRPPAVYGPQDKDMLDLFRTAKFGFVPLPPAGRTSLIHVDDLAEALIALAGADAAGPGRIYEPDDGQPHGYLYEDMAALIGDAVGRKVIPLSLPAPLLELAARGDRFLRGDKAKLTPDRVGYMVHPDWVCDPARAIPATLWTPRLPASQGFAQTADWYRARGWL